MPKKFKVAFELDEQDAAYFRGLYRRAKQSASEMDPETIIRDARKLVTHVRASQRVPRFVVEAIETLEDMTQVSTTICAGNLGANTICIECFCYRTINLIVKAGPATI